MGGVNHPLQKRTRSSEIKYCSESPEAAAPFPKRVDDQRRHEKTNGNAERDLDHSSGEVEDDGVEAVETVGRALLHISGCQ